MSLPKDSIENTAIYYEIPDIKSETETVEKVQHNRLALLLLSIFTIVESAGTALIHPLIPAEAARHGVDSGTIGLLFFIYSFWSLITALVIGKLLSRIGRKNVIIGAFVLKVITYTGFLWITTVDSKMVFVISFALLHVTQGMCTGSYHTAAYSSLTIMYPHSIDYAISWFETSSGIGFSLGPAIGSFLFTYGGYHMPFLIFLIILVINTSLAIKFLPDNIEIRTLPSDNQSSGSYLKLISNKRIVFALLITGLNALTYDFLNPILSDVVDKYYGIKEGTVGWLFWIMGIGYVLSWQLTNVTAGYMTGRRLVLLSLIFNAVSTMFLGASNILNTDAILWVTIIALFVSGISSGHFTVFIYSEIIEPGMYELGIEDHVINGIASGLSRTCYFWGQMASYSIGGYFYDAYGFSATIDSIAILTFSVTAIYFVMCDKAILGSPDFIKQDDWSSVRRPSLRELLI